MTMAFPFTPGRVALALLCAATGSAWAVEFGTVLSSIAVVASVPVPQRQCVEEQRVYPPRSSGAGALIGAIAGAAIGHSSGSGAGQAAATGLGLVAGSVIGDRIETEGTPAPTQIVQRCRTVTRLEQRTIGYDVVYEYQGVQRTTRLAQEPGDRIALDIAPVGQLSPPRWSANAAAPAVPPIIEDDDADRPPPRVVYVQPDYRPVPVYAYGWPYPAVGLGVVIGPRYGWGRGGHHHGHHRGHYRRH
jgi:uncharacterized protein YcfJ